MPGADLIVTNFNPNFTGVSATAASVVAVQHRNFDMRLAGRPLPDCPDPVSKSAAIAIARQGPVTRPFQIWHVRRNPEMQLALFIRDVLRIPIKIVFTSAAQRLHSRWPRFLIGKMDAIIATSEPAATYVANVWSVTPHGVDTKRFYPAENRAQDWAGTGYPGELAIACVGRIRPEKGTDKFVDAAIQILQKNLKTTALVIGRAKPEHQSFLEDLKNRVAGADLSERILFVGEISADRLPSLMRSLSLLIALPRYEGYGMTPLEAMASGVPVIASPAGHFDKFTDNGRVGVLLDANEADLAATAALELLTDPQRLAALADQSTARAREFYDVGQEVDAINQVYERLWSMGN